MKKLYISPCVDIIVTDVVELCAGSIKGTASGSEEGTGDDDPIGRGFMF